MGKLTFEAVVGKSIGKFGDVFEYSSEGYTNTHGVLKFKCPVHGWIEQLVFNHLHGNGCPKCSLDKLHSHNRNPGPRKTREFKVFSRKSPHSVRVVDSLTLAEAVKEIYGGKYHVVSKYRGAFKPITINCARHGNFVRRTTNEFLSGRECPKCKEENKLKLRFSLFVQRASATHKNKYRYDEAEFSGLSFPAGIVCPIHGQFTQSAINHVNGSGCPKCSKQRYMVNSRKSLQKFIEDVKKIQGKYGYDYSKFVYKGANVKGEIVCKEHGSFWQTPHDHLKGRSCYKCFGTHSKAEDEVAEYVSSFLTQGEEVVRNTRDIIPPKELDLYIPSRKLAIEYCGLYWHCEDRVGKTSHRDKMRDCRAIGVRLITLFENEWVNRRTIVEGRLKAILGSSSHSFGAREVEIRAIPKDVSREFFKANHIQGDVFKREGYGAYKDGELVAAMTFGKPRYSSRYEWELLRYAILPDMNISGVANKLFKTFIKEHSPQTVGSYCDLRWGIGGIYERLGFKSQGETYPNYFYFHKEEPFKLYPRVRFQKHKLPSLLKTFESSKTEAENMRDNGYSRIFDCGNALYIYSEK